MHGISLGINGFDVALITGVGMHVLSCERWGKHYLALTAMWGWQPQETNHFDMSVKLQVLTEETVSVGIVGFGRC